MDLKMDLIIGLIFTASAYLIVPFICLLIAHTTRRWYRLATIQKITMFNGIGVWLLFRIKDIISGGDIQTGAAVFLWSGVAYIILKKYALREDTEESEPEKTEAANSFLSDAKKEKQRNAPIVIISILLALSIAFNIYQYCATPELDNNIINQKLDFFDEQKLEFFDEYVVFVEDDGTNLYHKYECDKFKGDYFWAYNTDQAIDIGYVPCPRCCQN
jgi:hypothetical protein